MYSPNPLAKPWTLEKSYGFETCTWCPNLQACSVPPQLGTSLSLVLPLNDSAIGRKSRVLDFCMKAGSSLWNHITLRSVILSTVTVHCHLAEIAGYEYLTNLQLAHLPTWLLKWSEPLNKAARIMYIILSDYTCLHICFCVSLSSGNIFANFCKTTHHTSLPSIVSDGAKQVEVDIFQVIGQKFGFELPRQQHFWHLMPGYPELECRESFPNSSLRLSAV